MAEPVPEVRERSAYLAALADEPLDPQEIGDRLDVSRSDFVFKGSDAYLQSLDGPVESEAVNNLVRIAEQGRTEPLFVVAIGAPPASGDVHAHEP